MAAPSAGQAGHECRSRSRRSWSAWPKRTSLGDRYFSRRRGYGPSFGLLTIKDRSQQAIRLRHTGSADEAETAFRSPTFKADLERIVHGEDHVTPAAKGIWYSWCKTQFAGDPRLGGLNNFIKAHLGVLAILEHLQSLGFIVDVNDEGHFWETKAPKVLADILEHYDQAVAGMVGAFKDVAEPQGVGIQSSMLGRPDFEKLEMQAQLTFGDILKKITGRK